jgi:SAM-dependent methyltransferase
LTPEARYLQSCRKEFWQEVFRFEADYLAERIRPCREVLSVGCGPAVIEGELRKRGFEVTGLDVSRQALSLAPDRERAVAARAEEMPFSEASFDAVVSVVSLQFVEDFRKALAASAFVLRPGGRIVAMLLNPESEFFRTKMADPDSYVRRIRHRDLREIEAAAKSHFEIRTEYTLGWKDGSITESRRREEAILYVLWGTKKIRARPGGKPADGEGSESCGSW